ncbi:MAG: 50S ribosomal protein L11 methyltransferase, partial [Oscillospiraceae bacterium]
YTATQGLDILAGFLTQHGIKGLVIEDSADFMEFVNDKEIYWDYIDESLMYKKEQESNIKFYLPDNAQGIETFNQIKCMLPTLNNYGVDMGRLAIEVANVNEEDWSTAWKKYYHPTPIGKNLIAVPCWEEYNGEKTKIILDPGMAFGTGTHETTRLCMQLLESSIKGGETMLDVGTGSGILAITALLLGAKSAVGIDIDELATKVAKENAELNSVEIELYCGDLTKTPKYQKEYDIITMNIVADVILWHIPIIPKLMGENSVLCVSGIIEDRCDEVISALEGLGLKIVERLTENDWTALKLVK